MGEFNVNISVAHLPQVDRLQNDMHRLPVVHQQQNAQTVDDEMTRRTTMPVEPDAVEKKNIDPDRKKERDERRKKKSESSIHRPDRHPVAGDGASFVDITA